MDRRKLVGIKDELNPKFVFSVGAHSRAPYGQVLDIIESSSLKNENSIGWDSRLPQGRQDARPKQPLRDLILVP